MTTPESDTEQPTEQPKRPWKNRIERGWTKRKCLVELAKGDRTMRSLAEEFDVSVSSIHEFKVRHIHEIDAIKLDIENELAGLWIAEKVNRLAEYESDVDEINRIDELDPAMLTAKHRALRSVAEELGHLPQRVTVQGEVSTTVSYSVEGVDLKGLQ